MKKIFAAFVLCAALSITSVPLVIQTGCTTSSQKIALTSLMTAHHVADSAFKAYVTDAYLKMLAGDFSATNGVPAVAREYEVFQFTYNAALLVFNGNSNAPASALVLEKQTNVLHAITVAK